MCVCVCVCACVCVRVCVCVCVRRKEKRSKQGQTNNKAKQHSTPKAVTFPKKNELPRVHVRDIVCVTSYLTCFTISDNYVVMESSKLGNPH